MDKTGFFHTSYAPFLRASQMWCLCREWMCFTLLSLENSASGKTQISWCNSRIAIVREWGWGARKIQGSMFPWLPWLLKKTLLVALWHTLSCRQVFETSRPHKGLSQEEKARGLSSSSFCLSLGYTFHFHVVLLSCSGQPLGKPDPIFHSMVVHWNLEVVEDPESPQ